MLQLRSSIFLEISLIENQTKNVISKNLEKFNSPFKFVRKVSFTWKENLFLKLRMNLSLITVEIIRPDKDIICLQQKDILGGTLF